MRIVCPDAKDTMSSTEAENKEIARRVAEEAWGEGKLELIDEYFAEEFVSHDPVGPEGIHGPEEYKEQITMFRSAFPDLTVTIEDSIAEGDKVVQRLGQTGTHEGEFMGVEPTGRQVTSWHSTQRSTSDRLRAATTAIESATACRNRRSRNSSIQIRKPSLTSTAQRPGKEAMQTSASRLPAGTRAICGHWPLTRTTTSKRFERPCVTSASDP